MPLKKFNSSKNSNANSYWVSFFNNQITACGAPSKEKLILWKKKGVTDIVTLLKHDEIQCWLPNDCKKMGIRWHHYPLTGKNLGSENDFVTLSGIPAFINFLHKNTQSNVVIHCSAGMHRTGVFLYLLFRFEQHNQEASIQKVQEARDLTAKELIKETRKGILVNKAESIYQKILNSKSLKINNIA